MRRTASVLGWVAAGGAGALLLLACSARSGAACDSEGEARCEGGDRMLVCTQGKWSPVACAGPAGCVKTGRFIDCDETLARSGDPCGADGLDSAACSTDGLASMRCDGSTWSVSRPCKGPKRCTRPAPSVVDCDDSIAEVGDTCAESQRSCTGDGSKLLLCTGGRMVVEQECAPDRCRASDDLIGCDD